jgi:hypothetical protein
LQVLHHAVEEPIFGLGMAEELVRQDIESVPAPCTHFRADWNGKGTFISWRACGDRSVQLMFRATPLGRQAHQAAKVKIRELSAELIEGD